MTSAIQPPPSREPLLHALYEAAELEHNLMCTYLYAAFSLRDGEGEGLSPLEAEAVARWRRVILQVAIEEMGHLTAVWNISAALGGSPRFGRGNLPLDPGALPAGLVVKLAPFSEVDVLVNNLGIHEPVGFFDETDDAWRRLFEVNVLSGVRLARHYLQAMLARKSGRVIFIASEAAISPSPEMAHHSATKTMQLSVSRSLAELTKGTAVTVNTVMPGSTWSWRAPRVAAPLGWGNHGRRLARQRAPLRPRPARPPRGSRAGGGRFRARGRPSPRCGALE